MSDYRAQIKALEDQIRPLQDELYRLHKLQLAQESPFQEGDFITWEGKRGRVLSIGERYWRVFRVRKDGSEGAKVTVYSWHKPIKAV